MILFENTRLPRMFRARRMMNVPALDDPVEAIAAGIRALSGAIKPKSRIGVCAGSRGIYNYAAIIKAIVDGVKDAGAVPFIIPAMGSHGGATAEGQIELLRGYGISTESMGAEILSSMETLVIGQTSGGLPVHFDKNAASMDGLIMANRVKPHTDFHSTYESGLVKQMVIGLGKRDGAEMVHRHGTGGLAAIIPEAAEVILSKIPVLMGAAILENAEDRTAKIEVIPGCEIMGREPELLLDAKSLMPSLPCDNLDILVISEMGKNISGAGIDTNIVGRKVIRGMPDEKPDIYRIVCLDLAEESYGNASGVGIADVITKRLYDKIDLEHTYINAITSGFLERGFIPIIADNDKQAVIIALNCCNRYVTPETARVIMIKNTLEPGIMLVSEALLPELREYPDIELEAAEALLPWDSSDNLSPLFLKS